MSGLAALALTLVAAGAPQPEGRWLRYGAAEGLSHEQVVTLYADRAGFVWVGTPAGLDRFDGSAFEARGGELPHHGVRCVAEDAGGDLWVGTYGGLARIDRSGQATWFRQAEGLLSDVVHALAPAGDGSLWVGTEQGLDRVDTRRAAVAPAPAGRPREAIDVLLEDRAGTLWVGTRRGLLALHSTNSPAAGAELAWPSDGTQVGITALAEDESGALWVGTANGSLARRDPSGRWRVFPDAGPPPARIHALRAEAGEAAIWAATARGLFRRYPDGRAVRVPVEGLRSQAVTALARDYQGGLWVGTGEGALRLSPNPRVFSVLAADPRHGLGSEAVWAVHEQPGGTLWIGGDAGLDRVEAGGRITRYRAATGQAGALGSNRVRALATAPEGLWVGTVGGGLALLRQGRPGFEVHRHRPDDPASLSNDRVRGLLRGRNGTLWVATDHGLDRMEPGSHGRFQAYLHDPADAGTLSSDATYCLYEDSAGALWVGTLTAGLNRLDPASGRVQRFQHVAGDSGSLPHESVLAVTEVRGELWVATGAGAARLDRQSGRFTPLVLPGLPAGTVYGVLPDPGSARLWLPTDDGLLRVAPDSGELSRYGRSSGLPSHEFNGQAFAVGPSGTFHLGSTRGLVSFRPEQLPAGSAEPRVALRAVYGPSRRLEPRRASEAPLSHDETPLTFEYSLLDFEDPGAKLYEYQLEGLDTGWIAADRRRSVTYAHLSPGRYRFRVRGVTGHGPGGMASADWAFTVTAPPWSSPWAWVCYVLAAAALVYAGLRLRFATVEGRARELERRVEQRTQALRASEERYRDLLDSSRDLIQSVAPDGRLLYVNRAWREALGYDDQQVAALNVFDVIDPADRQHCREVLATLERGGQVERVAVTMRTREGRSLPLEGTVTCRFEHGRAVATRAIFHDLSAERRAARLLERRNDLLAAIARIHELFLSEGGPAPAFDLLLDVLVRFSGSELAFVSEVLLDGEGRPYLRTHTFSDAPWAAVLRRRLASAPHGPVRLAPDGAIEFHDLDNLLGAPVLARAVVVANEVASDPRRGGVSAVHAAIHRFVGMPVWSGSELVGMVGVANAPEPYPADLADELQPLLATYGSLISARRGELRRREAEEQVRQANALLEQRVAQRTEELRTLSRAVEQADDGTVITDREGRILFVNEAFERQSGYSAAELVGQNPRLIKSGMHPDPFYADLWRTITAGDVFRAVVVNRRKDGGLFHEEKTISPIRDAEGAITHFVATGRDISERMDMEARLRRTETMAAMGRLVAGVAHEVRNPLFAITSVLDAFEEDLGGQPGFQEYGLRLRREVSRMTRLMQDLLDYARPAPVELKRDDLRPVLEATLQACAPRAEARGVALRLEADGLPPLDLDPPRLQQVFLNLVQNAIDFSQEDGLVVLTARTTASHVICEVLDDGPGLRPEDLAHAFEPFYTRRRGGTGLGLAIVQRLVEAHGGQVEAGNRPEGGAALTVSLPRP